MEPIKEERYKNGTASPRDEDQKSADVISVLLDHYLLSFSETFARIPPAIKAGIEQIAIIGKIKRKAKERMLSSSSNIDTSCLLLYYILI